MIYWLAYLALGATAGVLAGLLGVGGGIIIVPILTFLFTAQQLPAEYVIHLAIGSSLASVIFTSVSSLRAHHARGSVDWQSVRRISGGIVAGTLLGSWLAAQLSTPFLKGFFALFQFYVAFQLFLDIAPRPHRQLPGLVGMSGVGSVIGGISSLIGIGGGSMSVPFLLWCNVSARTAIGTSAAIGFPIAVAGTVGYVANGLTAPGLPPHSLGFVYLPALVGVALASILTAPLGARLAHAIPIRVLKRIFACILVVMGAKMLSGVF